MRTKWKSAAPLVAVAVALAFYSPLAAQTFSEWTAPVNVGATINSSANEV